MRGWRDMEGQETKKKKEGNKMEGGGGKEMEEEVGKNMREEEG